MKEIFARRSTRSYQAREVEEEKLAAVLEAGNFAPSAMNNQNRQFTVILNAEVLQGLNEAVRALSGAETVKRISSRTGDRFSFFYHAPILVVVSHLAGDKNAAADCACSLQNMFLAAEEEGLGSCWINQLNDLCEEPSVRALLDRAGVPGDHRVYGCAALGYVEKETPLREKTSKIVYCR